MLWICEYGHKGAECSEGSAEGIANEESREAEVDERNKDPPECAALARR